MVESVAPSINPLKNNIKTTTNPPTIDIPRINIKNSINSLLNKLLKKQLMPNTSLDRFLIFKKYSSTCSTNTNLSFALIKLIKSD